MRIFLSSVIHNMEDYRNAAAHALTVLGHEVKRAEDYGALPTSPQQACLAGVREAQLVVLLLGAEYGSVQPSGLSATHEEYREAKERCDVLAFVQKGGSRDAKQEEFALEVRKWQTGLFTGSFTTPDDLRDAVTSAVYKLDMSRVTGPVDAEEMVERAKGYVPQVRNDQEGGGLNLVVVGGPRQQVLRPAEIENRDFIDKLIDKATRDMSFFTRREGALDRFEHNALIIEQPHASILLDEFGTIRLMEILKSEKSDQQNAMLSFRAMVEEDIRESIHRMLRFAGVILDDIDSFGRLSDVAVILALFHSGYSNWVTRAELGQTRNNSWGGPSRANPVLMVPPVVTRKRAALGLDAEKWSEDLALWLRREFQKPNR